MTTNTCELTKTIEKLIEKDEKEFESGLKSFIQETDAEGKNFAQKYSEIQLTYLGASETKESFVVTLGIFAFSIGVAYALSMAELSRFPITTILIILFLIAFGIIAFLIPTKLPVFKKFDNKIKHYKEIIIKIEEEKYR